MTQKVPEFEQTKAKCELTLTKKITKHHLIQPVDSFTHFSCQHSHTSVLRHDKLIKCHGNCVSLGAVWRVGLSKANLFFMPCPASNKSSTTVLRVSWAVKLLLKHDPCHVGDLQDNWVTRDVKRSGWVACPVLYVKDDTQAGLIPLRPYYWPPSWEQKTLMLRRP